MKITYTHFQLFCGFGGFAAGIDDAEESLYGFHGNWECIGAVDSAPDAVQRFNRYCRRPVAKLVDLFTLEQYRRYWDKDPPAGWREFTVEDLRALGAPSEEDREASRGGHFLGEI